MKTLKIKEESLRETLKSAITEAHQEGFSGWRIPLFLEENGEVTRGSWLSQGCWEPDATELPVKIERWDMGDIVDRPYWNEETEETEFTDEDFQYEIEESADWWVNFIREYDNSTKLNFELV